MLKYLNKRMFICLSLALIILIVASFVASSVEAQGKVIIKLGEYPEKLRVGEPIVFNWNITQRPYSAGNYCFEIIFDPWGEREVVYSEERSIPQNETFNDTYRWETIEASLGEYSATIRFPCTYPRAESTTYFEVVETLLVIQKKLDDKDERLSRWEFKVTARGRKPKAYFTNDRGEIRIKVPREYEGKVYTIEEALPPNWSVVPSTKQTVKVPKGETKTVSFHNIPHTPTPSPPTPTPPPPTHLIIQKFNDTNRNYEIDKGDEKLPNWEYDVTNPAGATRLYKTDIYGEIRIDIPNKEEVGDYEIVEIVKEPGWRLIKKDTDAPIVEEDEEWIVIRVEKGKESTVKFLNSFISNGTLLIHKFHDSNRNKVYDYDEEGLGNWEFTVTQEGETVATCKTNETGFCALKLKPGRYSITENKKKGCRDKCIISSW